MSIWLKLDINSEKLFFYLRTSLTGIFRNSIFFNRSLEASTYRSSTVCVPCSLQSSEQKKLHPTSCLKDWRQAIQLVANSIHVLSVLKPIVTDNGDFDSRTHCCMTDGCDDKTAKTISSGNSSVKPSRRTESRFMDRRPDLPSNNQILHNLKAQPKDLRITKVRMKA